MSDDHETIAAGFDCRALNYARSQWHRACAESLIEHASIATGHSVIDAGAGTGFVALAAAKRVGSGGRVVAVDISPGMLEQARKALAEAEVSNVDLLLADACDLSQFSSASFDGVLCAAALLYMPVPRALAEWSRLLKPGGVLGFSSMFAGYPRAGQLFRDCAAEFGVHLMDPSVELGSESAAQDALESAGFVDISLVADRVTLTDADLSVAWESNLRSAAHTGVRTLAPADLERLRIRYENCLSDARLNHPEFEVAKVLYAYGRKR